MIIFSDHAENQRRIRKIPKIKILKTVKHADEILYSYKGRELHRRKFGNKILEVVTVTENENITIITQYYLGGKDEN